jgi:S-adenosylmethionine hydrolase
MSGVITLLSDFGTHDGYVGAMKGSILSIAPTATIVDISHDVPPQDVRFGAFTLLTSTDTFPPGTVHVAVVDPGVGGARRALAIHTGGSYFVGPDNGLLSWAIAERVDVAVDAGQLALPLDVRAVSLEVPEFWRPTVSSTFHGRDIFGPVAAHLSRGERLERMGTRVSTIAALPFPAVTERDGEIVGEVLVVDRFGNCITNIRGERLVGNEQVEIAGRIISGLSANYESGAEIIALIGSSGLVEIGVPSGNAAERLGVGTGARVVLDRPNARSESL